jgi:signal transduction histidine kinase
MTPIIHTQQQSARWPLLYVLTLSSLLLLFLMGGWWLYMLWSLSQTLKNLGERHQSLLRMIISEGMVFFILLLCLLGLLIYLIRRDRQKNNSLKGFMAAFSHELKTPLSTMLLQLELLKKMKPQITTQDLIYHSMFQGLDRLELSCRRLLHDTEKLLGFSRMELGNNLDLRPLNLHRFLSRWSQEHQRHHPIQLVFNTSEHLELIADPWGLTLMMNNLYVNAQTHGPMFATFDLTVSIDEQHQSLILRCVNPVVKAVEQGSSTRSTGLGLHLTRLVAKKMNAKVLIETSADTFAVSIHFAPHTYQLHSLQAVT